MEGKKKRRGGILIAKPDYKKAYVTLKNPLSLSSDLYPVRLIEEERRSVSKQSKTSVVEEKEIKSHWLDGERDKGFKKEKREKKFGSRDDGKSKFPWSSMRSLGGR
eukprot:TRINITY_DN6850_c0_g1_i1.p1 TRINITY_DN6850_c0_g1~~TRINITY_DN6850_c0_g1_i1.p1  ORF type:complete len:106 (+),score=27.15 TRINITY_DN6850_c0_g1_i1:305-622(+)